MSGVAICRNARNPFGADETRMSECRSQTYCYGRGAACDLKEVVAPQWRHAAPKLKAAMSRIAFRPARTAEAIPDSDRPQDGRKAVLAGGLYSTPRRDLSEALNANAEGHSRSDRPGYFE